MDTGSMSRCLVCPCEDLFIRKMFPQRLGITIVVIGFAISFVTWGYHYVLTTFAVLFSVALIDLLLYLLLGNLLECYRCQAQYREVPGLENFQAFDLETFERHQQKTREQGRAAPPADPSET